MVGGSVELYDYGDYFAGYAWQTSGVPSVPSSNDTATEFLLMGRLATNQTATGTTLGSVTRKLAVYGGTGSLLGYIPIYDNIT